MKEFHPMIFSDWLPLVETMTEHERSELLLALLSGEEPTDVPLWPFFKQQLEKQRKHLLEKSEKARQSAKKRWGECERTQSDANACNWMRTHANDANECLTEPNRTEPNQKKEVQEKPESRKKASAVTHRFDLQAIPSEWKRYANKIRPDLDAEKEFTSFAFYFTSGNGSSKLRSDKGWSQAWQGWVRRAKEHTQSTQTTNIFTVIKPRQPANRDDDFAPDFDMDSFGVAK